jgi:hypothetical protein
MKCQSCTQPATHHVTEIVAGKAAEYHVCDDHLRELDSLEPACGPGKPATGIRAFWEDPKLGEALRDPEARQQMAAHVLPALCLALLHERPQVRVAAAFRLLQLGPDARSAAGALRDALRDPDERVAHAARLALEYIEAGDTAPWFL